MLSNLYLRHIENNVSATWLLTGNVVNCFRTCIFVILKTTVRRPKCPSRLLWIAFELVSSSYWKQPLAMPLIQCLSCELLSNLYLRHIENNRGQDRGRGGTVVNCFRTCIFVILKTTFICYKNSKNKLWIAFELVSSSYWKQHARGLCVLASCCELLSNLYLRHIENNQVRGSN